MRRDVKLLYDVMADTRALKRAESSDLAEMQGSGYYQRDKTRWWTLYWTVRLSSER